MGRVFLEHSFKNSAHRITLNLCRFLNELLKMNQLDTVKPITPFPVVHFF